MTCDVFLDDVGKDRAAMHGCDPRDHLQLWMMYLRGNHFYINPQGIVHALWVMTCPPLMELVMRTVFFGVLFALATIFTTLMAFVVDSLGLPLSFVPFMAGLFTMAAAGTGFCLSLPKV
jgi:hypothetical protein